MAGSDTFGTAVTRRNGTIKSQARVLGISVGAMWVTFIATWISGGALLWLGVVRWLLRDDSSGRLQLETDKPRYREGERVELRAKTLTAAYAPEPSVPLTWRVLPLAGEAAARADASEGSTKPRFSPRTSEKSGESPCGRMRSQEELRHGARRS